MGGVALPSRTAPGATGIAAMELTGDPDMDRMILEARDAQGVSRDIGQGNPNQTMEEYQAGIQSLGEWMNRPENVAYRQTGGGSGLMQVLSLAAAVAIPFAAPALAGAIGASSAFGATLGSALTGAALGAGKAAVFGEDIGKGALMGGVSGGIGGYMQGAGATGAEATGAAAGGPQPLTMTELVGGTSPAAGSINLAPGLAASGVSPAAGAINLAPGLATPGFISPAAGSINLGAGLSPSVAAGLPQPVMASSAIPEITPFDTAGGEFVQVGGLQQSPVPTPAGTYDPATGLTGYIDQSGQFVQTASPVATPTGVELATGAAPAATAAQSPVFGVADLAAPTFGATGAMVAPIAGSVAGAPVAPSLLGGAPRAPGAQDAVIEAGLDYTGPQVGAVTGTGAAAPAVAGGTAPAGSLAGITPPVPGSVMAPAATGPLNAARNYLGSVGSNLVSGVTGAFAPNRVADLILRGAGMLAIDALGGGGDGSSALAGLSAEEQALVLDMRDELARTQQEDENLFNQRLQQAYALIGDVDYFDPEYFGLQSARRAQLQAARAKQAGLRGLTGEERAAEERRYDLETGRSTGTAYDVGYGTGLEARTRARQAGIEALPTSYPSALSDYLSLQDIYRGGSTRAALAGAARRQSTADLFGGLFGAQDEQTTGA